MAIELLWPIWVILCSAVHILRRSPHTWIAKQAVCALVLYAIVRTGVYALALSTLSGLLPVIGVAAFVVGHAILFGWAASPGGIRFLYMPIGLLLRRWPAGISAVDMSREELQCWGRGSTRTALIIAGIDLTAAIVIAMLLMPILSRLKSV